MNKKIVVIEVIIVIFIVIIAFYNFLNKEEEILEYENIVQEINKSEEEEKEVIETMKIHITGEVKNPGVIELEIGSRISDAIEAAGGITTFANLQNVNLAYELQDGQKLYIPNTQEVENNYVEDGIDNRIIENTNFSDSEKIININKATLEQLQEIPGIGPAMAKKIIDYREENGKFRTVEDIQNVSGIGEKKFENICKYISIK